jgi:5'-methylthioadenosine phosphorylase
VVKIGIIGGTGIAKISLLEGLERVKQHTPYGPTSDLLATGKIKGIDVVIISRHGDHHHIPPGVVNYRANIWALKHRKCTHIIATSACGSLREDVMPGDIVFPDQFIDRTTKRHQSFYEGHEFCHIGMAEPFCPKLRKTLIDSATDLKIKHHKKGTIVTIEGPRFSSKAESKMFQQWGGDLINMSTVPEVVLAREAEICYAKIALATDYDCWHETEESVSIDLILARMKEFSKRFNDILVHAISRIEDDDCDCKHALDGALI